MVNMTFRGAAKSLRSSSSVLALAVLAFFAISPGQAQIPEYRFTGVSVIGSERVSKGTILSYAGFDLGDVLTSAELNDAYQKIVRSGLFETVEFVPQGGTLLIKVTEYPIVSAISIEGNKKLSDDALTPLLKTKVRGVYSPSTAEQDAFALTEAYEVRGQLVATVTPKIIRRSENRVDVVFEVTEGRGVEVERLSFVGNRAFSDYRLRRAVETKQAGFLRFIIGRDTYAEDRIEFDKQVLTDFYQSRGYVDFQILNVNAEFARDRSAYFLTFNVREGLQYSFGEITTVSEIDEADVEDFDKVANIRAGQTYSPTAVDTVISRMEALATQKGIDFLRVEPRVTRNVEDQTLDIEFALVRGERIFVERIDIEGNVTTLDRVIRNQFRVVEGDPFNPRQIRQAAERIRALGYFSGSNVDTRQGSAEDKVVVDVDVVEQPTGSVTFGANFSVSDGANLIASFKEQNFLGRGQSLSFNLTTQLDTGTLSFDFFEPALLGRELGFGLGASIGNDAPGYLAYESRSRKISPRLSFPVSRNGTLSTFYRYAHDDIKSTGTLPTIVQSDIGVIRSHTFGYSYSYDTRRTGLNENAGVLLRAGQEFKTYSDDSSVVSTTAEATGRVKVLNEQLTLLGTLEGGMIRASGNSRVMDRYFSNPAIIRGFQTGGIGPRDVGTTDAPVGGNYFAVARVEAQFPLGLPEEYGLGGGVFVDYGSIWDLDNPGSIDDSMRMRGAVGASLFWTTPIGPLRFNFSNAFLREDYDKEQSFDLTISTEF